MSEVFAALFFGAFVIAMLCWRQSIDHADQLRDLLARHHRLAWSKVAALLNQAANLRSLLRDVREGLEQVRQVIDFSEFREIQPFSYVGIVEAFDKLLSRIDSQEAGG